LESFFAGGGKTRFFHGFLVHGLFVPIASVWWENSKGESVEETKRDFAVPKPGKREDLWVVPLFFRS
jgi:hypothetical protein